MKGSYGYARASSREQNGDGPLPDTRRENIRSRQKKGIAAAKARGARFGRPRRDKQKADFSL